nr:carnosine n-methyltransferase [Quercus suber]
MGNSWIYARQRNLMHMDRPMTRETAALKYSMLRWQGLGTVALVARRKSWHKCCTSEFQFHFLSLCSVGVALTVGEMAAVEREYDPLADPKERRVLFAALDSFRQYRQAAHYNVTHLRRQALYSLSSAHMDLLCDEPFALPKVFDAVDDAIDSNADLAEAILQTGLSAFGIDANDGSFKGAATPSDMDKARSTIRQFYRDWSAEGRSERQASFAPILTALDDHGLAKEPAKRHQLQILVPGAGLGRLVFELCAAGYAVEGNEISYHQLLASNYILNCTQRSQQHTVYPWALGFGNHVSRTQQMQGVAVPEEHPATALEKAFEATQAEVQPSERMSMTAGDFCVLYREPEYDSRFDAVTTCFFIDTAPNLINYIETVKKCLKPNGLWINLGPLLWHFEATPTPAETERQRNSAAQRGHTDSEPTIEPTQSKGINEGIGESGSFELTDAEVVLLVQRFGFELLEHRQAPSGPTGYILDSASMLRSVYHPSFWIGRKR